MRIAIELPQDIAEDLRARWNDLPRHTLEVLVMEGYRSGALTESEARRVLGFQTRMEVNSFCETTAFIIITRLPRSTRKSGPTNAYSNRESQLPDGRGR